MTATGTPSVPATVPDLTLARRGQERLERALAALPDAGFDEPSGLSGWSRRTLVAHIGLNARALTRLTHWAATGIETPMYDSPEQRGAEIEVTATLAPQALRDLVRHAAAHLDAEWSGLSPQAWARQVRTAQGRVVPASETVWMRIRETWVHAVDLAVGLGFDDVPTELLDALLTDVTGLWTTRGEPGLILRATDRDRGWTVPGGADTEIRATTAELVGWATGRRAVGLRTGTGAPPPVAPRWL